MIITRLQLAAMSRVDIPEEKRRDFFLYVDEFQNFATASFANILSEARKYRLSLVLAHQYIGQLVGPEGNTKVRDAVFGHVGTIITFRIGASDAEFLEMEFMPEFLQQDLVNLAKANVYLKLMIDGVASRPFSATTLPPIKVPLVSHRDIIIANTQQHYGTPRSVVESRIADEWVTQSDAAIDDKMSRRNERPLSTLRPSDNRQAPRSRPIERPRASNPMPPTAPLPQEKQTVPKEPIAETPLDAVVKPAKPKKQFPRQAVDIDALRKAISESLKKQSDGDTAA